MLLRRPAGATVPTRLNAQMQNFDAIYITVLRRDFTLPARYLHLRPRLYRTEKTRATHYAGFYVFLSPTRHALLILNMDACQDQLRSDRFIIAFASDAQATSPPIRISNFGIDCHKTFQD
jgi:hypothetical protein